MRGGPGSSSANPVQRYLAAAHHPVADDQARPLCRSVDRLACTVAVLSRQSPAHKITASAAIFLFVVLLSISRSVSPPLGSCVSSCLQARLQANGSYGRVDWGMREGGLGWWSQ